MSKLVRLVRGTLKAGGSSSPAQVELGENPQDAVLDII